MGKIRQLFEGETEKEKDARLMKEMAANQKNKGFGKKSKGNGKTPYPKRSKESEMVLRALGENEEGDAILFVRVAQGENLFDRTAREWMYWNDHYWRLDEANEVQKKLHRVCGLYGDELMFEKTIQAMAEENEDRVQAKKSKKLISALEKRITALKTLRRQQNILRIARGGVGYLWCSGREWDEDPWLLACPNGVINLKEGIFRPGKQEDWIRTPCNIPWPDIDPEATEYPENAKHPNWDQFLIDCFCDERGVDDLEGMEVIDFLQRLFGYAITGLSTEHIFPIFYGKDGRNGKSTLFEILKYILGVLAHKAPTHFLLQQKNASKGPDSDTVEMKGKRVVWCSETNDGDQLDAAKYKELSGGDTITARAMYARRSVTYRPTHTLFIHTNRKPRVPANDEALWQRMALIDFKYTFRDKPKGKYQKKINRQLLEILKAEAPGILKWLVQGCLFWQEDGCKLILPNSVKADTERYREEQDIVGHFIEKCCVNGDSADFKAKPKAVYEAYKLWCADDGHRSMAKNKLYAEFENRYRKIKIHGYHYFDGFILRDDWQNDD